MEDPFKINPPKRPFLKRQWIAFTEFWSERFSFLDNYSRFLKREKPLHWTDADVEHFIASDPVHGPVLKTTREAAKYAFTGSIVGAVSTAGVALKYSKSVHGAALSFVAGGMFGLTFGHEIANHTFQLYRLDTMAAQVKFLEWIEKRTDEPSSDEPFSESSDIVLN